MAQWFTPFFSTTITGVTVLDTSRRDKRELRLLWCFEPSSSFAEMMFRAKLFIQKWRATLETFCCPSSHHLVSNHRLGRILFRICSMQHVSNASPSQSVLWPHGLKRMLERFSHSRHVDSTILLCTVSWCKTSIKKQHIDSGVRRRGSGGGGGGFLRHLTQCISTVDAASSGRTILLFSHACSECIPTGATSSRKEAGNWLENLRASQGTSGCCRALERKLSTIFIAFSQKCHLLCSVSLACSSKTSTYCIMCLHTQLLNPTQHTKYYPLLASLGTSKLHFPGQ